MVTLQDRRSNAANSNMKPTMDSVEEDFEWQKLAEELMASLRRNEPRKFEDFSRLDSNRQRIEFVVNEGFLSILETRIWRRVPIESKRDESSIRYRSTGNEHFKNKSLDGAMMAYTMAAFTAETKENYALAVANRSACFLELDDPESCLEDIESALSSSYPQRLTLKILARKCRCLKGLGRYSSALEVIKDVLSRLRSASDSGNEIEKWTNEANELREKRDERSPSKRREEDSSTESETRFSESVSVQYSPESGRHLVADRFVKSGDIVIEETAFAHILIPEFNLLHCHHCLAMKSNLVPCEFCCEAGYCNVECRVAGFPAHHHECRHLRLLANTGIAHLSLKIMSRLGIEEATRLSEKFKGEEDKGFEREKSTGSPDEHPYEAVYGLLTHEVDTAPEDLFQYALTSLLLLRVLSFSEDGLRATVETLLTEDWKKKKESATGFEVLMTVGELLLRHIEQLICNASAITFVRTEDVDNAKSTMLESQVKIATAIFPCLSILNHSCDPNIIVSYVGARVFAKATRNVELGREIFNCYGPHHLRMSVAERRSALKQQYRFLCRCERCEAGDVGDGSSRSETKALRCSSCGGSVTKVSDGFSCFGCRRTLEERETEELLRRLEETLKLKVELKAAMAEPSSDNALERKLSTLLSKAEGVLFERNLDLAEILDMYAFVLANKNDFGGALRLLEKSSAIIKSAYGSSSVEFAYELRKMGELALNLDDVKAALEHTSRSRAILEERYSASHRDVMDLAEMEEKLQQICKPK